MIDYTRKLLRYQTHTNESADVVSRTVGHTKINSQGRRRRRRRRRRRGAWFNPEKGSCFVDCPRLLLVWPTRCAKYSSRPTGTVVFGLGILSEKYLLEFPAGRTDKTRTVSTSSSLFFFFFFKKYKARLVGWSYNCLLQLLLLLHASVATMVIAVQGGSGSRSRHAASWAIGRQCT